MLLGAALLAHMRRGEEWLAGSGEEGTAEEGTATQAQLLGCGEGARRGMLARLEEEWHSTTRLQTLVEQLLVRLPPPARLQPCFDAAPLPT